MKEVRKALHYFVKEESVKEVVPFGKGHINDTYKVSLHLSETFLLQRMHRFVFEDMETVMHNLLAVTHFLGKQGEKTLRLKKTFDQKFFHCSEDGAYWRMFFFEENSIAFEQLLSISVAKECAVMLASFHKTINKMEREQLLPTFSKFNHLPYHLEKLNEAVRKDVRLRLSVVTEQVDYCSSLQEKMLSFYEQSFPKRLVHNDAKLNNMLFHKSGGSLYLIDLDTIMLGYVHYDFGDMVRTICSGVSDDEPDLGKVKFHSNLYYACKNAYLQEVASFLTEPEIQWLDKAPLLMTYMMGIRFLTDYLQGDILYKVEYEQHNYHRLCCQFHLLKEMLFYFDEK